MKRLIRQYLRLIDTGTRKGRSVGRTDSGGQLQLTNVAIWKACFRPWPKPAHESALLEASGREGM